MNALVEPRRSETGYHIVGWDEDTPDTFRRTLDLCDELNIMPFVFTLTPMPGSPIYREYLEQGRIFTDLPWDHYGGASIVFRHPTMSPDEMFQAAGRTMRDGYSMGRILLRTIQAFRCRFSPNFMLTSYFTQMAIRKSYRRLYGAGLA